LSTRNPLPEDLNPGAQFLRTTSGLHSSTTRGRILQKPAASRRKAILVKIGLALEKIAFFSDHQ